jgi:hypothetical protein
MRVCDRSWKSEINGGPGRAFAVVERTREKSWILVGDLELLMALVATGMR